MNTLKLFRKPFLAPFFALLILFTSCSSNEGNVSESLYQRSNVDISKFARYHYELSKLLKIKVEENQNIDFDKLVVDVINDEVETPSGLTQAQQIEYQEIIDILFEMKQRAVDVVQDNPELRSFTEEEFQELLTIEIDLLILEEENLNRFGPCEDRYETAKNRCARNWTISLGSILVIGIVTGGAGWLASGSATGIFILCLEDAASDLEDCLNEEEQ